MIRKLMCWVGWHEWERKYKVKEYPQARTAAEKYMYVALEGFCQIWEQCIHCGKVR